MAPFLLSSLRPTAALAALLLASCGGGGPKPSITIGEPWARAAAPGRTSTAAYFTIANSGGEDRLLSVTSTAGEVSLHSTSMDDGVMRMRPVEALDIPAGTTVRLEPGGTHAMVTGLKQPLAAGSALPLDLTFERSGELRVNASVRER